MPFLYSQKKNPVRLSKTVNLIAREVRLISWGGGMFHVTLRIRKGKTLQKELLGRHDRNLELWTNYLSQGHFTKYTCCEP